MITKGTIVSSGYAFGEVFILQEKKININFHKKIKTHQINIEFKRFLNARDKTVKQLKNIKSNISLKDKKLLFDGYIMILEDKNLEKDIFNLIKEKLILADAASSQAIKRQVDSIKNLDNIYLKERANDILDIGKRLIANINNVELVDFNFYDKKNNIIIIAKDLSPSQIMLFNLEKVTGFITELGSITSHTSIIAKSLDLVSIICVKDIFNLVKNNDFLAIDAVENKIYINPLKKQLIILKRKNDNFILKRKKLFELRNLPAITLDGYKIKLLANINNIDDVNILFKHGAEGIGLYRTEFLFMDRTSFPSEDEQFEAYKKVAQLMNNRVVTIRTVDLGGDKFLPYMNFPKEETSFLGWRSIRIYVDRKDILHTQLRAILRASIYGNIRIMFPMIISMEEVYFLKKEINEVKNQLKQNNQSFNEYIKIGIMIETPAAAVISKYLAKELDFFSIGTNDLTQYTLAVDRNNSMISYLYNPLSPSIINLIKFIIDSIHTQGKEVGMCGELSSDKRATLLLLGLGLDELSMNSVDIPEIKQIIRSNKLSYSQKITKKILSKFMYKDILSLLDKK